MKFDFHETLIDMNYSWFLKLKWPYNAGTMPLQIKTEQCFNDEHDLVNHLLFNYSAFILLKSALDSSIK